MKFSLLTALLFLLLGSGCRPEPEEHLLLDCLLETFIDHHDGDIDDVIIIVESQGWTDSTTLLHISYCSPEFLYRENDFLEAAFKHKTILYAPHVMDEFNDSTVVAFDESRRMKTSLKWKNFDTTGLPSSEDIFMPPYDPPHVWIFVDNQLHCIDTISWGETIYLNRCGSCPRTPNSLSVD